MYIVFYADMLGSNVLLHSRLTTTSSISVSNSSHIWQRAHGSQTSLTHLVHQAICHIWQWACAWIRYDANFEQKSTVILVNAHLSLIEFINWLYSSISFIDRLCSSFNCLCSLIDFTNQLCSPIGFIDHFYPSLILCWSELGESWIRQPSLASQTHFCRKGKICVYKPCLTGM